MVLDNPVAFENILPDALHHEFGLCLQVFLFEPPDRVVLLFVNQLVLVNIL